MGQKSKEYQEMDRAIGQWKQQLLDEAEDLAMTDLRAFRADLAETSREFHELNKQAERTAEKASRTTREAKIARQQLEEDRRSYEENSHFWFVVYCFLGSLLGSFIMFLLLWYFW